MGLLLGIDLGTSYFKVGLFAPDGSLRGLGRVATVYEHPAPGRSEMAVEEFWRTLREGLNVALREAQARPADIIAISYSSQASTFVLLDAEDRPLTPLVSWTDARGEPVDAELGEFCRSEAFQHHIGFAGVSGQTAPVKWRWFQREQPRLWAATRRVLTISDYLTYALTGVAAGDASTAAFLGLYDLRGGDWWRPALTAFGVDRALLSRPQRPGQLIGRTLEQGTRLLGIPAGTSFVVGALDHHAAAIGSGVGALADVSVSTGTVLAALVLVDDPVPLPGCFYGPHADGRRYYRLAFDSDGARQLEEFQRAHAPTRPIEDLIAEAAAPVTPAGAAAREIMQRVSRAHVRLVETVLRGAKPLRILATGGGSRSPVWVQMTADALGVPVLTPASPERACLGAAVLAATAAGLYASAEIAVRSMVRPDREFRPGTEKSSR